MRRRGSATDRRRLERGEEGYRRFEEWSEPVMLVLALLSVPVFGAQLGVRDPDPLLDTTLDLLSGLIWAGFLVQYLGLLYLAPRRWEMVRTHVLDLVLIVVPFLRPLRVVRVGRLLRPLVAAGRTVRAFQRVSARRGFHVVAAAITAIVVAGGVLVWSFERHAAGSGIQSLGDAMWWAVVTATTVGYGDYTPITIEGRAIAFVMMLVGIGLLSVITANIAAYFVETGEEATDLRSEVEQLRRQVDRLVDLLESERA